MLDREISALHRLVQVALRADSLEMLCGGALDAVAGAIQVDRASILLLDESGVMRFKAWVGLSEAYRKAVEGHSAWHLEDPDPQPIIVNQAETDPAILPFREYLVREGIGSMAFVPLVTQRKLIGKFMLYSTGHGKFGPAELRLATTLAGTVALAIVRIRQEAAWQDRRVRMDAIFKALPVMIYEAETGTPFGATWLSPNASSLTGFDVDCFLHQPRFWEERIHPAERETVVTAFQNARLAVPLEVEYRWRLADGTYHWFLERTEATELLPDGRLRLVGIWLDITDRKRAEEALRQSELSWRGLFDCVRDAIYLIGPDGRFLDINQGAVEMYGYRREDILGKTAGALAAPGRVDLPSLKKNLERAMDGEAQQVEFWGLRKNGEVFPKEVRLYPGTHLGSQVVIALAQDVTERKRQEEAFRQTQKLESLGLLAGGIAHDFNNLLTALLGKLNLAQATVAGIPAAAEALSDIELITLRAAELTKQILAYSGKGHFVVRPVNLNAIVQEMARLLRASLSKLVQTELDLAQNLRPILADASQLQQVVMNLVTNAAEAIGSGQGRIQIKTSTVQIDEQALSTHLRGQVLRPGEHVALTVSDTGCGMPPDVLEKIFDPFYSTKAQGRGLGLSAMQGILRGHRAGILVRSTPGQGSTFTIYFPVTRSELPEAETSTPPPRAKFSGKVLLVDDEQIILESTGAALQAFGFDVHLAHDGVEALEKFRSMQDLDLVLMDVSMPRMDGPTAFLAMHQERAAVPVILSSGFDRSDRPETLGADGLAAFLPKPYRIHDLAEIVRIALANKPSAGSPATLR